jgi:hypothetical protein
MKFFSKFKEPIFNFKVVRMFENGCIVFWWVLLAIAIIGTLNVI